MGMPNSVKKRAITEYIKRHLRGPLYFKNLYDDSIMNLEYSNYTDLVIKCLITTQRYSSYNYISGREETRPNKLRSSIDIWRHCKFFEPEITIFQVMSILYKIKKELYANYCYIVRRLVFKYQITEHIYYHNNYRDEFGIGFQEWENIDKD